MSAISSDGLLSKILLLNIYTLFLVALWQIINGGIENFIFPIFNPSNEQKFIFWLILGILSLVLLYFYDRLDMLAECKDESLSQWDRIREQILLGLIFILFFRAAYNSWGLIFDLFFDNLHISMNFTKILINLTVVIVTFLVLFNKNRLDLIIH